MFKERSWKKWLLPGILVIALVGSLIWGYQEKQIRQKLQNRAEGQYQKAFHELTWHLDNISGQLAQILISSSREQAVLSLATLWRQAFAAQANIGSLPLALVPLSQTENFLNNTSTVANVLLSRAAQAEEGLSEDSIKTVEALYERSQALAADLNKLGAKILNHELSWTEVETAAYASNRNLEDNTIVDGFKLVEKRLAEYPEINLAGDFAPVEPETKKIRGTTEISVQEAEKKALQWWYPQPGKHEAQSTYEGVGDVPTYGIEIPPLTEKEGPVYIDVSKIDGAIVWAMEARPVEISKLTLGEGEKKAQKFLKKHDLFNFVAVKSQKEDNTGVYTFVPRQGEVLLYPDQVKLQVALDNGDVLGFEGTPYYMFHRTRDLPVPKLTRDNLRSIISPRLKVELIRPALIVNTWGQEVLTWEVRGAFTQEKFAVFYNAQTGSEEAIIRITPPPEFTFTVAS
ncbi:MAG TPA: germination protein YpeB [Clostridia bacterium]|jgi:spore germination protein|nr:germination protein YpeB [Clostridia bacterium]